MNLVHSHVWRRYLVGVSWVCAGSSSSDFDDGPEDESAAAAFCKALGAPCKKEKPPLSFVHWSAAYLRWALSASAAGQLTLAAAWAHYDCVLRAGEEAKAKTLPLQVAVLYDQLVRKAWERDARLGVEGFSVDRAAA